MEKFKVFGLEVPIITSKDLVDQGVAGMYHIDEKKITVDETHKDNLQTLMHEGGHAVFERLGWNQCIPQEVIEIIVDTYPKFIFENFKVEPL